MSMLDGLGRAMGDAAEGAALGKMLGDANRTVHLAVERANQSHAYSQQLEAQVNALTAQLRRAQADRKDLAERLQAAEAELARFKALAQRVNSSTMQGLGENLEYGRAIQHRLRQVEKALQHSSGDKDALRALLEPYKALVDRFNLHGELPADMQEKAEGIYKAFMAGQSLTSDPNIQKMLDAAPLPVAGPKILF